MAGRKKGSETGETKGVEVVRLGEGKVLVRSWTGFVVPGPQGTYSSTNFGHEITSIADDDEMMIASKAEEHHQFLDQLNSRRHAEALAELVKYLNIAMNKEPR